MGQFVCARSGVGIFVLCCDAKCSESVSFFKKLKPSAKPLQIIKEDVYKLK